MPFEPTAFPSGPHVYLMYELHLTNFMPMPISLSRIDVLDADAGTAQPIATFEAAQLEAMLQPLGGKALSDPKDRLVIARWPERHRLYVSSVRPRLTYSRQTASSRDHGLRSRRRRGHFHTSHGVACARAAGRRSQTGSQKTGPATIRTIIIGAELSSLMGKPVDSRRFAIDWKQIKDGATFSGDARDVHSYYSYGKAVLAVADGRVVTARDGLPENIPGHGDAFHPAVPITLETVAGNTITLDLGGGQFAYYMHLQPGSLRVKAGDRVRRGQVLARIGASGDAREPHLHFEVTTSSKLLAGEGVPYLIDRYSSKSTSDGPAELHTHELPLDKSVVIFGEDRSKR